VFRGGHPVFQGPGPLAPPPEFDTREGREEGRKGRKKRQGGRKRWVWGN